MRRTKGVVFLDIDGVFCTNRAHVAYEMEEVPSFMRALDPISIMLVDRIALEYELDVVISSTWRSEMYFGNEDKMRRHGPPHDLRITLRTHGFRANFHDDFATPDLVRTISTPSWRGNEINQWLEDHPEVKRYIIFDDDYDFNEDQHPYHVQTDCYDGVSHKNYHDARDILDKMDQDDNNWITDEDRELRDG